MSKADSPQTQTTQSNVTIPKELQQYINGSNGVLSQASNLAAFGNLSPTVGASDATTAGRNQLEAYAQSLQEGLLPQTNEAFSGLLNSDLVNSQQLQDAISASTNPIQQQLERFAIPATQDAALTAGQLGSSRQGIAEGLARSDANKQMGDIGAQLAFGALQTDNNNRQFALNFAPQLANLGQLPSSLLSAIGAQDESFALNEASSESRNLTQLANLLQGFIPGANTSTTTTSTPRSGGLEGLGTALSLASLFMPQLAPFAAISKVGNGLE